MKHVYRKRCPRCNGSGEMDCCSCHGTGYNLYGGQCGNCGGTGRETCDVCGGSGEIEEEADEENNG